MADLISKHLARRKLTTGAQAGIGVVVALVGLIAIGIAVFVLVRRRRSMHLADIEQERSSKSVPNGLARRRRKKKSRSRFRSETSLSKIVSRAPYTKKHLRCLQQSRRKTGRQEVLTGTMSTVSH
jgi:hypothetical protein